MPTDRPTKPVQKLPRCVCASRTSEPLGAGPPSRRLRVFPYYGGSTKNLKYAQASLCILAPGASEPPGSIYHATSSHKVRATNLPSVRSRRGCRRAEI